MAGGSFQEGFVQGVALAVLISQEFSGNRTMASGGRLPDITRKESGNLGYCHLSKDRVASFKNRTQVIGYDRYTVHIRGH